MNKTIPIFFTYNDNYAIPAIVAFYSLLNRAKENVFYKMYVLHRDISDENKELTFKSLEKFKNFELNFIKVSNFLEENWEQSNWGDNNKNIRFTQETLYRCFAAKFFPEFDRIIYSDVDVLFVDDISELYDINLDNKYIGTVKDAFLKYDKFNEIGHLRTDHYEKFKDTWFAGGIWVMNLKKIREDNLEKRMIDIIKDNSIEKKWYDMDVMNIACDNKVEYIPLNYICYPFLLEHIDNKDLNSTYSREELYDSLINPKIIHYAGMKPWNDKDMPFAIEWWTIFQYLQLPQNSLFIDKSPIITIKKKYKKLFNIFFIISIILFCVCLIFPIFIFCFNKP